MRTRNRANRPKLAPWVENAIMFGFVLIGALVIFGC